MRFRVLIDGHPTDLDRLYGTGSNGVYGIDEVLTESDCSEYHFRYMTDSGLEGTFPERAGFCSRVCLRSHADRTEAEAEGGRKRCPLIQVSET